MTVGNPINAGWKLATCFHEFLDRLPGGSMRDEQPNRQQRALLAANSFAQPRQISPRAAHLLHSATPFGIDKQHTEIRMAPHIQVDIDTSVIQLHIFRPADSLHCEAGIVIATLKRPALSGWSQEVSFQFCRPRPAVATT